MAELTEKVLRKYLRANPTSTLFARYADLLLEREKIQEAYVIAIHGVKSHPRFATGWLILGKAAMQRGEASFAKQCWMNALAADKMCLRAAELLLTTEGLDLKMKEAHIAATALLNMDRNHLLARTTMKLIAEKRRTATEAPPVFEEPSAGSPGIDADHGTEPETGEPGDEAQFENLTTFDLYGTDKHHISDILKTIDQMRRTQGQPKSGATNGRDSAKEQTSGAERDKTQAPSHEKKTRSREQTASSSSSKETMDRQADPVPQEDITIPARMATLTFVEVLKAQGLYENALTVLKMIPRTSANADRIEQERNELKSLLEMQQQE